MMNHAVIMAFKNGPDKHRPIGEWLTHPSPPTNYDAPTNYG